MRPDMRSMCVVRKTAKRDLNILETTIVLLQLDFGKREYRSKPPVFAIVPGKRLQQCQLFGLAPGPTREADQTENTGGRRQHHGVARPIFDVLADHRNSFSALTAQDLSENGNMTLLARC